MIEDLLKPLLTACIGIVIGVSGWVVRRIFTNQKELEENRKGLALLEQKVDLQHNEVVHSIEEIKKQNEQALSIQSQILGHLLKKNL
jgi:uncharacterized membrane protein (DUF106 family)